jgi:AcrR family transcriptional regulator
MPRPRRNQQSLEAVQETRRAILRVAHRLFMEEGFRAVSTRQIAEACGLTQPALYYHFSDKRELYVAVLEEDLAEAGASLERIARRSDSMEERLRLTARYILSRPPANTALMFHDIQHELTADQREALGARFFHAFISPIASIFGDGLARGEMRPLDAGGVDPVTASFLFLRLLRDGRGDVRSEGPQPEYARSDTRFGDMVVHVLLHGLARAKESRPGGEGSVPDG